MDKVDTNHFSHDQKLTVPGKIPTSGVEVRGLGRVIADGIIQREPDQYPGFCVSAGLILIWSAGIGNKASYGSNLKSAAE